MKLRLKTIALLSVLSINFSEAEASTFIDLDQDQAKTSIIKAHYTDPSVVLATQQMLKDVTETLDKNGIRNWAAFGTLLGAYRQRGEKGDKPGGMIPWDDDADIGIFYTDKGTVRDRPFRKIWDDLGYKIVVHDIGLQVQEKTQRTNPKTNQPYTLFVDIFLFKLSEDGTRFELTPEKAKQTWPKAWLHKAQLENLVRIPFGEFTLNAPSDAIDYLTNHLYGADWKTKGYIFSTHHVKAQGKLKWTLSGSELEPAQPTGPLKNRVNMPAKPRAVVQRKESLSNFNLGYWNKFYAAASLAREPSSFCRYILEKGLLAAESTLLDVGCGNGRDTFAFRKAGIHAYGLDSSQSATESNLAFAKKGGITDDIFKTVDVCSAEAMKEFQSFEAVYARFFVHAINEAQQAEFLKYLSTLNPGARLFLEFRTDRDPMFGMSTKVGANQGKTDHYRRFINFGDFVKTIYDLGFTINESTESDNLSVATKVDPVKGKIEDNPMLGRIIATKK